MKNERRQDCHCLFDVNAYGAITYTGVFLIKLKMGRLPFSTKPLHHCRLFNLLLSRPFLPLK
jgi:hypothetical protein